MAMAVACLDCIRYGGHDRLIICRLHEVGREDCCDQRLVVPPAVRTRGRARNPPAEPPWWRRLLGGG
jgi:hypothetical protein